MGPLVRWATPWVQTQGVSEGIVPMLREHVGTQGFVPRECPVLRPVLCPVLCPVLRPVLRPCTHFRTFIAPEQTPKLYMKTVVSHR